MITRADRRAIEKEFPQPDPSKLYRKLVTTVRFINMTFSSLVSIPDGYQPCPRCGAKNVIAVSGETTYGFTPTYGSSFLLWICGKCEGAGYVDWIRSAMSDPQGKIASGYFVPLYLLLLPRPELLSTIFYSLFYQELSQDQKLRLNPRQGNKLLANPVRDFLDYFRHYKKERDKRKQFINDNFDELRKAVLERTKVAEEGGRKILCRQCKSQPIDIEHNEYEDTISVIICGNCYGAGYQARRDAKGLNNFRANVESPDYHNREKMLEAVLETAESEVFVFYLMLSGLKKAPKRTWC
jgi:hypothetical protein